MGDPLTPPPATADKILLWNIYIVRETKEEQKQPSCVVHQKNQPAANK